MFSKKHWLLLFLITVVVYCSSLTNQFVWDDEQFIYRNEFVANFDLVNIFTTNTVAGAGEVSNYYRPLTTLSFAFDYQFWQLNPIGYHIVNILLHAASGILLYELLKRLQFSKVQSLVASLIFLTHPVQVEAVTYMNSRGDSLFSFFGMVCLLLTTYVYENKSFRFVLYDLPINIHKTFIFLVSIFAFIACILSKEIGLAILGLQALVILRLIVLEASDKKIYFQTLLQQKYFVLSNFIGNCLVVAVYLFLRSSVLNFDNTFNFINDTSLYSQSLMVRLLTFVKIIFIYIQIILVPFPLHMERTTNVISSPWNIWLFAFLILVIGLAYVSYLQWKKNRQTTILFGWMWSTIMLVPVSGIIAINGMLYEHWLYLPLIGFALIILGLIDMIDKQYAQKKTLKYFFIALIGIYCLLTTRQNYFWSTPIRLYTHLLKYTDSARIHNNLAMAYSEESMYQEALNHYQLALKYGIPYPQIYHNMGNTYVAQGDEQNAENSYIKALELDPSFYHTYINLINLYMRRSETDKAISVIKLAQEKYPQVIEYQLIELQLLQNGKDELAFNKKKQQLEIKLADQPQILESLQTLHFIQ